MWNELGKLVAGMNRGEPGALNRFVTLYGDPIRRAARRRISQLGLEREVEPDHILNSTILELCQSAEPVDKMDLDDLWLYVDLAVRLEASETWRHRNARFIVSDTPLSHDRNAERPWWSIYPIQRRDSELGSDSDLKRDVVDVNTRSCQGSTFIHRRGGAAIALLAAWLGGWTQVARKRLDWTAERILRLME